MNREEIILNVLNDDKNNWFHLMEHDRKNIAHILAKILDAIENEAKEQKQKEISDEIQTKLDSLSELIELHDNLDKIPWYKFSERKELKFKILELESKQMYG